MVIQFTTLNYIDHIVKRDSNKQQISQIRNVQNHWCLIILSLPSVGIMYLPNKRKGKNQYKIGIQNLHR